MLTIANIKIAKITFIISLLFTTSFLAAQVRGRNTPVAGPKVEAPAAKAAVVATPGPGAPGTPAPAAKATVVATPGPGAPGTPAPVAVAAVATPGPGAPGPGVAGTPAPAAKAAVVTPGPGTPGAPGTPATGTKTAAKPRKG